MSNSLKPGCSRRQWCAAAGAGLLVAAVGCDSNPIPGGGDGGVGGGNDMASPGDMAQKTTSSCSGSVNAGPASGITQSAPKLVNNELFVCRDSGGLYAMSAICTHAGCTVRHQSSDFYCPCHGATFDLNGQNPTGPAFQPLDHYSLCVDANGNVVVDPNTTVSATTRTQG